MRRLGVVAATAVALAVAPGAAAAAGASAPASAGCAAALPVSISTPTANAAALQRVGAVRVTTRDGARVSKLHVILRRNGRTVAQGSRGKQFTGAVAVRLSFDGTLRSGSTRVVVSGRQAGCSARREAQRVLALDARNLPVRVMQTERDLLDGRLAVTLGVNARKSVSNLRARLLDSAGTTIAQVTRRASSRGSATLDFSLRGSATGRRWLLVTGGVTGEPVTRSFADRIDLSDDPALGPMEPGPAAVDQGPPPGAVVQHASVDWSGGQWRGRDSAGFYAAGIGDGQLVCRPDTQWMRVFPADRTRDATMMLWTFHDWEENSELAVRESEMTQYTGPDFNEGFNKFQPAEKRAKGMFYGVIGDGLPVAGVFGSGRSPTEVRVSWSWDFSDEANASCHVDATFTSQGAGTVGPLATALSLGWRGADGVPADTSTIVPVPGLGSVRLRCDPGGVGVRGLFVEPSAALPGGLQLTTHEGSDTSVRTIGNVPYLVPLPNNGMVEVTAPGGASPLRLVMSSRWKINDPDPAANFCRLSGLVVAG